MKRGMTYVLLLSLCVAFGLVPAAAQRVTSDILGTVKDASDAAIVGAKVTVTHVETGHSHETATDASGNYRVSGLEPGTYEVHVQHQGFKTTVRKGITVLVSQQAVVDVTLQVGDIQQRVEVTGEAALVETTTSQMSNVVTENTLRQLPLNGRDLFQLTQLQTGVLPTTNAGPSPWSEGGITKAAVQGARPTMNNFTLDGGDINDPGFNVYPGGSAGVQLGVEAVKEFRVLLNTYSAEYGRNAGANIQLVTRSGTNELHGSIFEFHRNGALDARNFFDPTHGTPLFIRNQFGATLGGPIVKNKTFFFVNYEGLREIKSITASTSVPDANAQMGRLPSAANPAVLVNVGVDPRVAAFLALFPPANGASLGGGLAVLQTAQKQPTNEHYGLIKIDHQITDHDQFFGRYVIDDSNTLNPFQSTFVPGFQGERVVRNQYVLLNWQHTFGTNLLNEAKFNFNRTRYEARVANSFPLSISLEANRPLGAIAISGLPAIGNNLIFPLGTTSNTFEGIDNLSWQRGHHSLKFGTDIKRMQINGPFDLFIDGEYVFTDLTPFGFPAVSNNPALEFFLKATPFIYLGTDPAFANSDRGFRQTYTGLYAQDDWRVTPRLTVNLGLRWEYSTIPTEAHGRVANIRNVATDAAPTPGKLWDSVPKNLFSPRFGFAWTPFANQKTVVRGGYGLLRDQIWSNLYFDVRFYQPFYRALLYILPTFQSPPASVNSIVGLGGPPGVIGSFGITFRPKFPYYNEYNLSIQRELAKDLLIEVAYVGSHGVHLVRTGEANPAVAGVHLNPNFGSIPLIVTDATSNYNSGQLRLQKRFSQGLSFQASYTYSKAIDDQSGPFPSDYVSESGVSQDFFNRRGDRARASFDRKHAFVFNALYELPFGQGQRWGHDASGIGGKFIQGWRIGGIITLISGPPFTANLGSFNNSGTFASFPADRPNLVAGAKPCGSAQLSKPTQWFDPSIFSLPPGGRFGNVGRNILCGPDLKNFDFSLSKDTKLGERIGLEFRAEFFNLFNHANFDVPVNTQGPNGNGGNGDAIFTGRKGAPCNPATDPAGCGILAPNVGRVFRTATPSRQIQFALKLTF